MKNQLKVLEAACALARCAVTAVLISILGACGDRGGNPPAHTIGGTVSGLSADQRVTLRNNGANPTPVTANGAFTFGTPVVSGGNYAVTVSTQHIGKTCTVASGSGSGVTANVTVTCKR